MLAINLYRSNLVHSLKEMCLCKTTRFSLYRGLSMKSSSIAGCSTGKKLSELLFKVLPKEGLIVSCNMYKQVKVSFKDLAEATGRAVRWCTRYCCI